MAPLDPSNTARVQVLYTSGEFNHTVEVRLADTPTVGDAETLAADLAALMAPFMATGDSAYEARLIPQGVNVYTGLSFTPVAGTGTAAGAVDVRESSFVSFTGRSNDGRRTGVTIFSQIFGGTSVFRVARSSLGTMFTDLMDFLAGQSPVLVTISGEESHWHQYANFGFNSHYQRKQR